MRKIELEELKAIELDMLKYIDEICVANDIPYFVCGGTLIGAIRHGGFIPWDDDIDIGVPRNYYDKLKKAIEAKPSCYKLAFYDNEEEYGYSMPKLYDTRTKLIDYKLGNAEEEISVFVDVFLFDGLGNSLVASKIRFLLLRCFKRMVFLSRRHFKMETVIKTILFSVPWAICKLIGAKRLNACLNSLAAKKDFNSTNYVAAISGRYGTREIMPRTNLDEVVRVKFEDTAVNAPKEYDKYLTSLYGDYMKLPPEEARVSNHTSDEWWID